MLPDQTFYAWFLHREMIDAMFDDTSRHAIDRLLRRGRTRGDQVPYARELEAWLARNPVPELSAVLATGEGWPGQLVTVELPFAWSDVAGERRRAMAGEEARSSFRGVLTRPYTPVEVFGTFNPLRLTCSTANSELRGIRTHLVFGQIATAGPDFVELRPAAIATRLVA